MHKILFYNKFIIHLYMFQAPCAHHQEVKIVLYSIWCHHTCRWPFVINENINLELNKIKTLNIESNDLKIAVFFDR